MIQLLPSDVASLSELLTYLAVNGGSAAAASFVTTAVQSIALAAAGQWHGTDAQAAFAVGLGLYNVLATGSTFGFLSVLDTLCSHAFGAGEPLAPILRRVMICVAPLCLLLAVFFVSGGPLIRFAFDDAIATGCLDFLRWTPAYIFINALGYAMQRCFAAQQAPQLALVASLCSLVACPLFSFALVPYFGTPGLALALTATAGVNTGVCLLLAVRHPASKLALRDDTWALCTWEEYWSTTRAALPAMIAVCAEWWAFEALVLIVSGLGAKPTAIFALLLNLIVLLTALPGGIFTATLAAIGNRIGRGEQRLAEEWHIASQRIGVALGVFDAIIIVLFGPVLFHFFTHDDAMIADLNALVPALVGLHFLDVQQLRLRYAYRAVGRQDEAAKRTLLAMWALGLPLTAILSRLPGTSAAGQVALSMLGFSVGLGVLVAALAFGARRWQWGVVKNDVSEASDDDAAEEQDLAPGIATTTATGSGVTGAVWA